MVSSSGRCRVPDVNGHSCARLRSRVVLPLPDVPEITNDWPASSRTSIGSISRTPVGVRTSTLSSWIEPSVLETVALGHLGGRLDEVNDWAKVLSPGEQQRVAFARVLLTKPKAVFLDEATSAIDEGQEFALYRALRERLPDCIVVSVSHRPTLDQHHERRLELLGDGAWRLEPV